MLIDTPLARLAVETEEVFDINHIWGWGISAEDTIFNRS
jgi:hypothetical protein